MEGREIAEARGIGVEQSDPHACECVSLIVVVFPVVSCVFA